MVKTYVSKPVEIQAIQYTGGNFDEIKRFTNLICDLLGSLKPYNPPDIYIDFGGYYAIAECSDYICKDNVGKVFIEHENRFKDNYEVKE